MEIKITTLMAHVPVGDRTNPGSNDSTLNIILTENDLLKVEANHDVVTVLPRIATSLIPLLEQLLQLTTLRRTKPNPLDLNTATVTTTTK